jgi:prepilin-type N-terminal cleavage/methylation domain-containing protein
MLLHRRNGLTLVEMLIAMAIIGVIATFTVPKLLLVQSDTRHNAIAKEAASMVAQAYAAYRGKATPTSSTRFADLTPYMNYVKWDNSAATIVDNVYGSSTVNTDCGGASNRWCLHLHNGAILTYFQISFGGTANTNAIYFQVDPDGVAQSTANGPGKAVQFFLYYNGRITSKAYIGADDASSSGNLGGPRPDREPPWFSWSD